MKSLKQFEYQSLSHKGHVQCTYIDDSCYHFFLLCLEHIYKLFHFVHIYMECLFLRSYFCLPETKVAVYWFCNLNRTLENCGTQKPKLSETAPCLDSVRARTLHSTGLVCKLNFLDLLAGEMVIKSE